MFNPKEILPFDCPEIARPVMDAAQREADVYMAASHLRKLRQEAQNRAPRVYTGRIDRKRGWRGLPVIVPGGKLGNLILAKRGIAVVSWTDPFSVRANRIGYFHVTDLVRFKTPAAVLLGSLKRGAKEQPSARKAKAARINGSCLPRPGSRPRGRPRATPPAKGTSPRT